MAPGSSYIYNYPQGLQKLLELMNQKYQNPKFYITENGIPESRNDSIPLDQALKDPHQIDYVKQHLFRISKAIKNDVNVKGYFYWTSFDALEWGLGTNTRYGLYFVDYNDNLKRIPKQSAKWLCEFLLSNSTQTAC
ncbi:beta-glucosidase 24-like [Fagus crenata]